MSSAQNDIEQCGRLGALLLVAEYNLDDAIKLSACASELREILVALRNKVKIGQEVAENIARGIKERGDAMPDPTATSFGVHVVDGVEVCDPDPHRRLRWYS